MNFRTIVCSRGTFGGDPFGNHPLLMEDFSSSVDLIRIPKGIASNDDGFPEPHQLGVERQAMDEIEPTTATT